ncbi:MAG: FkbM family methyltransferase [Holophagales bacterium]|nr:FkbM family methyltransferase [Holophagales bacterium]
MDHRPRVRSIQLEGIGDFEIHVQSRLDLHISEAILRYGCWEPFETELMRRLLRAGETYVDVGANIGWFTLVAARLVGPGGRVFAFEPEPENGAWLRHNVRRNRLVQVRLECVAADDTPGEGWLHRSADNLGDHRIFASEGVGWPVPIEKVRLDDYFDSVPGPVHMVKIDTQGAETRVLRGFRERLARDRPILLVELWPFGLHQAGASVAELLELLGVSAGEPAEELWIVRDESLQPASRHELVTWAAREPGAEEHVDLLSVPSARVPRLEGLGLEGLGLEGMAR